MEDLERSVRDVLTPMITSGEATHLGADDAIRLARWACKTAMTFEFTSSSRPIFFSAEERQAIAFDKEWQPPTPMFVVWLGRFVGRLTCTSYGADLGWDFEKDGERNPLTGHCSTISVGQFAFQVFAGRPPAEVDEYAGMRVPLRPGGWDENTVLLWPSREAECKWPPSVALDEAALVALAERFDASGISPT
jgi:hypothetical protein